MGVPGKRGPEGRPVSYHNWKSTGSITDMKAIQLLRNFP